MFSRLTGNYKRQVIQLWQTYAHDRLVTIEVADEPTETLSDDPHKDEFMRYAGAVDSSFTIPPTVESQVDGEVTRYLTPYY